MQKRLLVLFIFLLALVFHSVASASLRQSLTILAFGDLMLDRNVFAIMRKTGRFDLPFLNIDEFLKSADLKVANLEGQITDFPSVSVKKSNMQFTFSPKILKHLKDRFDIFSLANNHTLDFGKKGLFQTRNYLIKTGIEFFGDTLNRKPDISKVFEKNGIKIGFVGYNALFPKTKNFSQIMEEIKDLKTKSDFVVVYPHWGIEYKKFPSLAQKNEARMFIDAGADLILGSHPHVIQPIEIYNNKVIFYSLGNFVFDQYFSKATMEGLAVKIFLEKDEHHVGQHYELSPFTISRKSQPALADEKKRKEILEDISRNSFAGKLQKEAIAQGIIDIH